MRNQPAIGIHHIGIACLADLDIGNHLPT
jgi:hypothetical protein